MFPEYIVNDEGYYIINDIQFESLEAYYDYIS